jgi:hypothetical protein
LQHLDKLRVLAEQEAQMVAEQVLEIILVQAQAVEVILQLELALLAAAADMLAVVEVLVI